MIKIIYYIRMYGIPELLVLFTTYKLTEEEMDYRLSLGFRAVGLFVAVLYFVYKVYLTEIQSEKAKTELRIKQEELRSIELDNQLKEQELNKPLRID